MDVVTPDYYATLGVAPSSEDVVIRAAYLALMRRYHPDKNASAEAAARVRAITAAYAVLGDWDRRAEYDLLRTEEATTYARPRRRPSPTALFAVGAVALLLMVVAWPNLPAPNEAAPALAEQSRPAAAQAKADPAALCASRAVHEQIKRELFHRAARLRGSDQAAFERIAGSSLIRVDSPKLEGGNEVLGTVRCKARVAVDLPPGVAVLGGQRALAADIDYSVEADGGGSVGLSSEGQIVAPLATLAQVRRVADPPVVEPPQAPPPVRVVPTPQPLAVAPARAVPVRSALKGPAPGRTAPPAAQATAAAAPAQPKVEQTTPPPKPSFSCRYAKGRGENAVCANANLARLDRHLAVFYAQSWGQADAARREKLLGTRERFIARRDACRSDACVNQVYVRRMREVGDIMATKN